MTMNNKGVGAVFCLIASILMAARHVTAAIYMGNFSTKSNELFRSGLDYIGPALPIAAIAALIVGVVFVAVGIIQDRKGS